MAHPAKPKPQDYEHLGQVLEDVYLTGYAEKRKLLKMSFLKGLAAGAGGIIGATIVVATLLWIFARLGEVPLVGPVFDSLEKSVESRQQ